MIGETKPLSRLLTLGLCELAVPPITLDRSRHLLDGHGLHLLYPAISLGCLFSFW